MNRAALSATLLTVAVAAGAPTASAAGPRPLFQSPAPCGQVWTATTYSGHDFSNSIDMAEWSGSSNISDGEPVLASADGTVTVAGTSPAGSSPDYGNYVEIDHGGGWMTRYAHLKDVPDATVGQAVAQGEQIGRIGQTGGANGSDHLHYTQFADGAAQRVWFNGAQIDTNGSDMSTWGKYGQSDAEQILSHNCPQNAFVAFTEGGSPHEILYKPGTGAASIQRINAGGHGSTTTFTGTWSRGWTHLTSFPKGSGFHQIAYKGSTGEVKFGRIEAGTGVTTVGSGNWGPRWTHIVPLALGGDAHVIVYSSMHGAAVMDRINSTGNGIAYRTWSANWGKGWTHFAPFRRDGVQYLLSYKGGTGDVVIDKVTLQSGGAVSLTRTYTGKWTTGWSHIVPAMSDGQPLLLTYKATTGTAKYLRPKAGGAGVDQLAWETWTLGWTAFTPYLQDGKGHYQAYKGASGQSVFDRIDTGGAGTTRLWTSGWTTGWA